jgi:hypothetical protein
MLAFVMRWSIAKNENPADDAGWKKEIRMIPMMMQESID